MKIVVLAVLLLAVTGNVAMSAQSGCGRGEAKAFISIRWNPRELVGQIPSEFSSQPVYFERRYNCTGESAAVRRVGLGVYDVRFPGLSPRLAVVSAMTDESITASALPLNPDIVRVALRGPLGGSEVASRRDVAFSLVIY